MYEEGIQQQVQVTVSVDHPLKDETQQFFFHQGPDRDRR